MNINVGSVFSSSANRLKFGGIAIVVLAVAVTASAGWLHVPLLSPAGSPMVATMKPLAPNTIAPLEALDRATVAVTERVMPTVVRIQVEGQSKPRQMQMPDNIPAPFRQFFQGPHQNPSPQPFVAVGSGIIVSPSGYIVTNNHVVNGAKKVQVQLSDERTFPAKVVGTDSATDLAVIKIDATGLTSAAFGDSSELKVGQTVLAIGDPLDQNFSVTRGIVSALNRQRLGDGPDARGNFIQTDAPINHGNSGGPLVDIYGHVVGINTEMLTGREGFADIGFAIPSNLVKSVAADLIKDGKVVRGYLGIEVGKLTPNIAATLNEPNARGVLVEQVNAGSPAALAGIKPYDVLTKFNGSNVANGGDLQVVAGAAAPGTHASIHVLRNGKPMTFDVTMGNFANSPSASAAVPATSGSTGTPKLGITVTPLNPTLRSQLQLPDSVNGLVVESVEPDSPAMVAGLSRGDVIEQINQHPVSTPEGLEKQLEAAPPGRDVLLMVNHRGSNYILPVSPQR
ncbi:MAG: Do family serine endopeptidase [Terriglobales bacterium]